MDDAMPVFDFKCTSCGDRREHIVLPGQDAPAACERCGGAVKRVYGGGRVHISFEGWGFSKTDGLIADTRGKDFKALKERAQRMVDE